MAAIPPVNRNVYLADPDVDKFVDWLCANLSGLSVQLELAPSPRVPGGLIAAVHGVDAVLRNYIWRSTWTGPGGQMDASNWTSTQASLAALRAWVTTSFRAGSNTQFLDSCNAVLDWGGVPKSKPWLSSLSAGGTLITVLGAAITTMNPKTAVLGPPWATVARYNAGMTKIYSLLSGGALPIYDSRVGAAIGGLLALSGIRPARKGNDLLVFPSGAARGNQCRDAGELWRGWGQPQFYSKAVPDEKWAKASVKLAWILEEVLTRCKTLFPPPAYPDLSSRLHALEAALFMIGYDLRALLPVGSSTAMGTSANHSGQTSAPPPATGTVSALTDQPSPCAPLLWGQIIQGNWVPTSHDFGWVVQRYDEFRKAFPGNSSIPQFVSWLIAQYKLSIATARSYAYPLRPAECDIAGWTDQLVAILSHNPTDPRIFAWLRSYRHCDINNIPTCIVNVFLVGMLFIQGFRSPSSRKIQLQRCNLAGTTNSAAAIEYVGLRVGIHLDLLSPSGAPTGGFYDLFY